MGVVSAMNIRADIPPITRQNTKKPSLILSLVSERDNQESGFQLQYTSPPPERRTITMTLMTEKMKGTMKSSPYVFPSILAKKRIAPERTIAIKRGAIKLEERRQRRIAPSPAMSLR
jgi:hypothetical protein